MVLSFVIRFNVTIDMEATWHHLGAVDFGIELGVIGLDAKALTIIFWHEKYISRTVPGKMQPLFEPSTMENIFCMYFNCKGIKHKT